MSRQWRREPDAYPKRTAEVERYVCEQLGLFYIRLVQGNGYLYWLNSNGDQLGDSVPVCYVSHMKFSSWVTSAREAIKTQRERWGLAS